MANLLDKVRQKSPRQKKQIAFLLAFLFSGIIFVIWLSVIYPDLRQSQSQIDKATSLEPSPLSTFGDTLSGGINAIKDSISSAATSTYYYNSTTTTQSSTTQP